MQKIGFIMLFVALFLTACQKNLDDIPKQTSSPRTSQERLWMIKNPDGTIQTKATAVKDKQWEKGDTIRIKFLPGGSYSPTLENYVKQYAAIWLKHANLHFEYVNAADNADVKIGFDLENDRWITWSTIGKDCQAIAQDQPSLHFFALGDYSDEIDIQGDVLRGFGHVLGLVYEHQSPQSPIQFNARAKNWLMATYGLSEDDVSEIQYFYNTDQTNHTEYDATSIMVLNIPRTVLVNGNLATPQFNTELSDSDITFIKALYLADPIKENLDSLATVNINAINAHIAGQSENYKLTIGTNYDGGEELPFIAIDNGYLAWYGYVSHGIIHTKEYEKFLYSNTFYDGTYTSFIFKNELYITAKPPTDAENFYVYTLNTLEEKFNMTSTELITPIQCYRLPYMYKGKKFITGSAGTLNGKLHLSVYNLDEKKESLFIIDSFPNLYQVVDLLYIKDNFIYFILSSQETSITSLFKMPLGTFNSYALVSSTNKFMPYGLNIATNIDGTYYKFCTNWGKALTISPNDEIEVKSINFDEYTIGYMNKLYRTNTTSKPFYTQVEL